MKSRLQKGDALVIIDAQIDFFPGGALPVPDAHKVLPLINNWIEAALQNDIPIFASRDWHPINHCSFKEQGGPWPVHCVQFTKGAQIHPDIHLPTHTIIIDTADNPQYEAYSAFEGKNQDGVSLDSILKQKGVRRIWLNGLAQDYCVCESALDARKYGYEVHLLIEGTRAITKKTGQESLKRMKAAGVIIETDSRTSL